MKQNNWKWINSVHQKNIHSLMRRNKIYMIVDYIISLKCKISGHNFIDYGSTSALCKRCGVVKLFGSFEEWKKAIGSNGTN